MSTNETGRARPRTRRLAATALAAAALTASLGACGRYAGPWPGGHGPGTGVAPTTAPGHDHGGGGGMPDRPRPTLPAPPTTAGSDSAAGWRDQMLAMVNAERAKAGLPPMKLCGTLNKAAQAHADDIAGRKVLTHTGADGSSPGQRERAAGYVPAPGQRYVYGAENAGMGYRSVAEVMAGWMGSAGHRANILSGNTDIGFGRNGVFWVQDFGAGGTC